MTAEPTPLASSEVSAYQSGLWGYYLPNRISSIYEPAKANGSLTTATTTCSGLGGSSALTVSFVQARATSQTPTPTPTYTNEDNMVANEGSSRLHAGSIRYAVFGAVVAFVGLANI